MNEVYYSQADYFLAEFLCMKHRKMKAFNAIRDARNRLTHPKIHSVGVAEWNNYAVKICRYLLEDISKLSYDEKMLVLRLILLRMHYAVSSDSSNLAKMKEFCKRLLESDAVKNDISQYDNSYELVVGCYKELISYASGIFENFNESESRKVFNRFGIPSPERLYFLIEEIVNKKYSIDEKTKTRIFEILCNNWDSERFVYSVNDRYGYSDVENIEHLKCIIKSAIKELPSNVQIKEKKRLEHIITNHNKANYHLCIFELCDYVLSTVSISEDAEAIAKLIEEFQLVVSSLPTGTDYDSLLRLATLSDYSSKLRFHMLSVSSEKVEKLTDELFEMLMEYSPDELMYDGLLIKMNRLFEREKIFEDFENYFVFYNTSESKIETIELKPYESLIVYNVEKGYNLLSDGEVYFIASDIGTFPEGLIRLKHTGQIDHIEVIYYFSDFDLSSGKQPARLQYNGIFLGYTFLFSLITSITKFNKTSENLKRDMLFGYFVEHHNIGILGREIVKSAGKIFKKSVSSPVELPGSYMMRYFRKLHEDIIIATHGHYKDAFKSWMMLSPNNNGERADNFCIDLKLSAAHLLCMAEIENVPDETKSLLMIIACETADMPNNDEIYRAFGLTALASEYFENTGMLVGGVKTLNAPYIVMILKKLAFYMRQGKSLRNCICEAMKDVSEYSFDDAIKEVGGAIAHDVLKDNSLIVRWLIGKIVQVKWLRRYYASESLKKIFFFGFLWSKYEKVIEVLNEELQDFKNDFRDQGAINLEILRLLFVGRPV